MALIGNSTFKCFRICLQMVFLGHYYTIAACKTSLSYVYEIQQHDIDMKCFFDTSHANCVTRARSCNDNVSANKQ